MYNFAAFGLIKLAHDKAQILPLYSLLQRFEPQLSYPIPAILAFKFQLLYPLLQQFEFYCSTHCFSDANSTALLTISATQVQPLYWLLQQFKFNSSTHCSSNLNSTALPTAPAIQILLLYPTHTHCSSDSNSTALSTALAVQILSLYPLLQRCKFYRFTHCFSNSNLNHLTHTCYSSDSNFNRSTHYSSDANSTALPTAPAIQTSTTLLIPAISAIWILPLYPLLQWFKFFRSTH